MTASQREFDNSLSKETDVLYKYIEQIKTSPSHSVLKKLESQKNKVRLMIEQSKVLGDWTFSSQTDYLPKETNNLSEFKVPLLALGIIACILWK